MAEKRKITAQYAPRYRKACKCEKTKILNEYLELVGGNRKYAIFKLNRTGKKHLRILDGKWVNVEITGKTRKKRVYTPYYGVDVAEKLQLLWENFSWPCGKLFASFLRNNLDLIRKTRKYAMSNEVAFKLKKISPRTIDRLLHKPKQDMKIRGTCGTKPARVLLRSIKILSWLEYKEKPTGYFQIDLVQHDGGNPEGDFCYTLTMTDVKTGWTIHFALLNKAATWVTKALESALKLLPMGIKGIHSDTGSEFINYPVEAWCGQHGVEFSKGRVTHKNDNCAVEQKNYAKVRKIVGYFRYQNEAGLAALKAVYDAYDPILNLYYPCMKQISCERNGAKKTRRYDSAKTPLQRLLECEFDESLEGLRIKRTVLALKETIHLVKQKNLMDKAVDSLLAIAHDVPMLPSGRYKRHG